MTQRPKPNASASPSYEVGYKKPPKRTQFKKGQSGNPSGRPKGSRNQLVYDLPPERLKDIILEEACCLVDVGPGEFPVPIAKAAMRSLGVKAAMGDIGAQRLLLQTLKDIEAQNLEDAKQRMEWIIDYKKHWTKVLYNREKNGLPLDPPVPHPDDIIIDMQSGQVEIKGPLCKEQKAELDFYKGMLRRKRKARNKLQKRLENLAPGAQRDLLQDELSMDESAILILESIVGVEQEPESLYEMAKSAGILHLFNDETDG